MPQLSRDQLENHLWKAADILRGSIDASDYKNYIFGFLFLKRLTDVFEEEAEKILARELKKGASEKAAAKIAWEDPDEHPFFVPPRARWSEIRKAATNIGEVLDKACSALEEQNPNLEGVLISINWNDEHKLGDAKQRDQILHRLVNHFSELNLKNENMSELDMLGRAYEYLIERFADDAGKKGGEFYTPKEVVRLIVRLLDPREKMQICDPTCGSGGMLIESARYIKDQKGNPKNITLYGQEKNLGTWAICKMNMLLHGLPDAKIEKGDTIRDPKLVKDGELMLFDRVIANPPFSLDEWGREAAETDGYGRFKFGIPPKSRGDLAFVQHMVATLKGEGKLGVVMPHGVLFRGAAEGKIRQGMLEEDLFEAVIGLPVNLFYGTGIPACILIMSRDKEKKRKNKVLFVNASEDFIADKNQNRLGDQHIKNIVKTVRQYDDIERYARVVGLDEIKENNFNLNISRYVDITVAEEKIDLKTAIKKLRELEKERGKAEEKMNRFLKELGYV